MTISFRSGFCRAILIFWQKGKGDGPTPCIDVDGGDDTNEVIRALTRVGQCAGISVGATRCRTGQSATED